jgi:hypothetical protein
MWLDFLTVSYNYLLYLKLRCNKIINDIQSHDQMFTIVMKVIKQY